MRMRSMAGRAGKQRRNFQKWLLLSLPASGRDNTVAITIPKFTLIYTNAIALSALCSPEISLT